MDLVGHFIARLTLIVPFFIIGFAVEALLGVECARRACARNISVNCLCTVLFFAGDVLAGAAWNYYLTDAVRSLPGAGAIALPQPTHLSATYVITMTVIWLAIPDFGNYRFHRLQHTSTWLWAEHEVHHSEEQVNVTSAYRHHWLEVSLKAIFISARMTYLFVPPTGIAAVTYVVDAIRAAGKALESAGARVKAGDLGAAKSQLMAQAVALNAMFAKFADMAHHTDLVYPPRAIHAFSFARTKPVRADPRGPRRLEEPDGHRQAGERRPDPASPQWSSATGRARGPPQSCAEQTSGRGECRTRTDGARSGARRRARRFTAGSRGSRAP